jgi:transcriptional regulator with XRE-family HTH domain
MSGKLETETTSIVALDPPAADTNAGDDRKLAKAIGAQIRTLRKQLGLTVSECALRASLSVGMLSKIENGNAQPSLTTLHSLSKVFSVPLTIFFKKYEESRTVSYAPPGKGILIERTGSKIGHQYYLLGQDVGQDVATAPHLIVITDESEVFPTFQHTGTEFIYMLEGEMEYQLDDTDYLLTPGTSLFFDGDVPHGPVNLIQLPTKFLSIIIQPRLE